MSNAYVPNNPCPVCTSERLNRVIHVVDTECWSDRCLSPMKVAFGDEEGCSFSPEEFTEDEIQAARAAGALLELRYSKTVHEEYLANVCPKCKVIVGSFFLHRYWDLANETNKVLSRVSCSKCEGSDEDDDSLDDEEQAPYIATPPVKKEAVPSVQSVTPAPQKPAPVLWGKCGHCGATASPRTVQNGRFFCSECNAQRPFVPDAT